jgi:hypothetical protein
MSFTKPTKWTQSASQHEREKDFTLTDEESHITSTWQRNEQNMKRLNLAHYHTNKNNTSMNHYDLDVIIMKAMTTPGTDASRNLKKKYSNIKDNFEGKIGHAAQMIELTGKALTCTLVLSFYRLDTSIPAGIQQLKDNIFELFELLNPKIPDTLLVQIRRWLETSYFTSDYLKYYRDFRTDIAKNWHKIFFYKPSEWIRNSLDGIVYRSYKSHIIYPSNHSESSKNKLEDTNISIFGMLGL